MFIFAVLLLLFDYSLARSGALGPDNNYLAPSGWQVFTSSQTLTCFDGDRTTGLPTESFQFITQATVPTRVGRNQSVQVRTRMKIITPAKFTTDLAKLNITKIVNSTSILAVAPIGTQNFTGAYNILYWPADPERPEIIGTVTPPVPAAHQSWSFTLPPPSDSPLRYDTYFNQRGQFSTGDGIPPSPTASDLLVSFPGVWISLDTIQKDNTPFLKGLACFAFPITPLIDTGLHNGNFQDTPLSVQSATLVGETAPVIPRSNPEDHKPIINVPQDSLLTSVGLDYTCSVKGVKDPIVIPLSWTTFVNASYLHDLKDFTLLNTHGTFNVSKSVVSQIQKAAPSSISALQFEVFNISTTGTGISPSSVYTLLHAQKFSAIAKPSSDGSLMIDFPGSNAVLDPVHYFANSSHLGEPVTDTVIDTDDARIFGVTSSVKVLFGKIQMNIVALDLKFRATAQLYTECSPTAPTPLLAMSILCHNGTQSC